MFPLDSLEALLSDGALDLETRANRRGVLLVPLLAALPLAISGTTARADKIDPSATAITLRESINGNLEVEFRRTAVRWPGSTAISTSPGLTSF